MSILKHVAERIYRGTPEAAVRPSGNGLPKGFRLVFGAGLLLAVLGQVTQAFWKTSRILGPEIGIKPAQWRVLYEGDSVAGACGLDASGSTPPSKECPASPSFRRLWESPYSRADRDHLAKLQNLKGQEYWLGAMLSRTQVNKATSIWANHLVLGFIPAEYEIWVDGSLFARGSYQDVESALVVTLPVKRLAAAHEMYIAVKIRHSLGAAYPDAMGIDFKEGLATAETAEDYRRKHYFDDAVRPWFFAGIYLMIGFMFLGIWIANPGRQEYGSLGVFGLLQALIQTAGATGSWPGSLQISDWHRIDSVLSFYEAGAAFSAGLAFARSNRKLLTLWVPPLLLAPLAIQGFLHEPLEILGFKEWVQRFWIPLGYFLGAGACLLQAYWLGSIDIGREKYPARIQRLAAFAVGFLLIGSSYAAESSTVLSSTQYSYWFRFTNLAVMLLLTWIVLWEYRAQQRMVESTPASSYHRRPVVPAAVEGILLKIDLKDSERLFRLGARSGSAGGLVHTCLTLMWSAIAKRGGTVVHTEGDSICALFEKSSLSPQAVAADASAALGAVDEISIQLADYARQLRDRGLALEDGPSLQFRASLVQGAVKPIWHEIGGARYPGWIETGSENAFVECSRILELERDLPGSRASLLVMPESFAAELERLEVIASDRWLRRNSLLQGKHGQWYRVAALEIRSEARTGLKLVYDRRKSA